MIMGPLSVRLRTLVRLRLLGLDHRTLLRLDMIRILLYLCRLNGIYRTTLGHSPSCRPPLTYPGSGLKPVAGLNPSIQKLLNAHRKCASPNAYTRYKVNMAVKVK